MLFFDAIVCVIADTETCMRGGCVCGLETGVSENPHVVEIRSDNAGERIV
jgi:hypothetical protein